jgi:hypothetical protein
MKRIILSAAAVMTMASVSSAGDDLGASLKNGKFSVDARAFYMSRHYDGSTASREGLTVGGTMKYESADYYGVKANVGFSTSSLVANTTGKERGGPTALVQSNGDSINLVSIANLEYNVGKTMVKVGRQGLNTPIFCGNDSRMIQTYYEAAVVRNKDIAKTMIEAGYVVSTTGYGSTSNTFDKNEAAYGDNGVAYLYVTNNSIKELTVRAFYGKALSDNYETAGVKTDIDVTDYRYAEVKYDLPFGKNTFVTANYAGNNYENGKSDSMMLGASAGTTLGMFDIFVAYEQIMDNDFACDQGGEVYTDYQQGYNSYGPSKAFGAIISAKPIKNLSVALKGAFISADEYKDTNTDSTEDFNEYNLDTTYAINDWSKLRVRLSLKDQSGKSGLDDSTDGRVIYYVKF